MSTTSFFYYDQGDQKQGPFNKRQIRELAAQKIITSTTLLETDSGHQEVAGQISGLFGSLHSQPTKTQQTTGSSRPVLFDIGFTRFFTNILISIIWCIIIFAHFLGAFGAMFYAFDSTDRTTRAIFLLAVPLITVISLLFSRMGLEFVAMCFRIEKNTRETKEYLREIKEQLGGK